MIDATLRPSSCSADVKRDEHSTRACGTCSAGISSRGRPPSRHWSENSGRTQAWLLAASMAGSFAFGLLYHFVIPGPDNVFTQPPGTWRTAFGVSAALLLPLQGAGCLVGLWAARALSRRVSDGAARPVGSPAGPRRTTGRSLR